MHLVINKIILYSLLDGPCTDDLQSSDGNVYEEIDIYSIDWHMRV